MCGIAGVRRFGDTPITREELILLLGSLEHRGNDASGIAIANSGGTEIVIHKMPVPAWSFAKDPATKGFLDEHLRSDTEIVLLHTRAATCGTPEDNENNHPMFAGKTAVVHNGGIRNADSLFKSEKLHASCATDSDYIRAVFDETGFEPRAARMLSKAYGSGSIAAVNPEYPGVLALGRSGNPVMVAEANDKLYFASEMQSIHKAIRPWIRGRSGLWLRSKPPAMSYHTLADDSLYYIPAAGISGDEQIPHHEMKISFSFQAPVYRVHENYAEKRRTWSTTKEPDRIYTQCRKCQKVQSRSKWAAWKDMRCAELKCDESFAYLDEPEEEAA